MDAPVHSLELSLWKDQCAPPLQIPDTSLSYGHVDKGRYITTFGNITFSLPLKWRTMLWITTILQHHAIYHAGNGREGHIFSSLVWFYDGLFQHLTEEASKEPSIPEDWSLPAWDRYFVRLRLGIGHSPLDLHLSRQQLSEAYANQPALWSQGLRILIHGRTGMIVLTVLTLLGLPAVIENNTNGWKWALLTVGIQHFQCGLPEGISSTQAWVDLQYQMLLYDLQPRQEKCKWR